MRQISLSSASKMLTNTYITTYLIDVYIKVKFIDCKLKDKNIELCLL